MEDFEILLDTIDRLKAEIVSVTEEAKTQVMASACVIRDYQEALNGHTTIAIERRSPSVIRDILGDLQADLNREKHTNDNGGWSWIRAKIIACCSESLHIPRSEDIKGTKYEVMGWMHNLCSQIDCSKLMTDITIEHQRKADVAEAELEKARIKIQELEALLDSPAKPAWRLGPDPAKHTWSVCGTCLGALNYYSIGQGRPACLCVPNKGTW